MNQCQPMLKQGQIIKMIVSWDNSKGSESHCLARIYLQPERVIILATEVRSNFRDHYHHPGISSGFSEFANTLYRCIPELLDVAPENILWIAHYGQFSHYDALGPDTFRQMQLRFHDGKFEAMRNSVRLTDEEVAATLGNLELENVYSVLREIGWTRHNE